MEKSITNHNYGVQIYAKEFARNMQSNPSPLEEKMMEFLDKHGFNYTFQKIFYIKRDNGYIDKFFIADFYFSNIKTILETDGQFHKKQIKYDIKRTELITSCYPDIKILRWEWKDFDNTDKVKWLLRELHFTGEATEQAKSTLSHKQSEIEPFFFTYINDISSPCHYKTFDVNTGNLWSSQNITQVKYI